MILVDANILLYAAIDAYPQHERAHSWLDEQLSGHTAVGLPWESLLAFARVSTNPRLFQKPLSLAEAWGQIRAWIEARRVWIPQPSESHAEFLGKLLECAGQGANLVSDAHLAAIAMGHGLVLCSSDGDFARFPGLRWMNPLR